VQVVYSGEKESKTIRDKDISGLEKRAHVTRNQGKEKKGILAFPPATTPAICASCETFHKDCTPRFP
jgi:hypothetical protein